MVWWGSEGRCELSRRTTLSTMSCSSERRSACIVCRLIGVSGGAGDIERLAAWLGVTGDPG